MKITEVNSNHIELARVSRTSISFRLLALKENGVTDGVGITKLDYRREGDDFRAGMVNMPVDVARRFARIILAELDGVEVSE